MGNVVIPPVHKKCIMCDNVFRVEKDFNKEECCSIGCALVNQDKEESVKKSAEDVKQLIIEASSVGWNNDKVKPIKIHPFTDNVEVNTTLTDWAFQNKTMSPEDPPERVIEELALYQLYMLSSSKLIEFIKQGMDKLVDHVKAKKILSYREQLDSQSQWILVYLALEMSNFGVGEFWNLIKYYPLDELGNARKNLEIAKKKAQVSETEVKEIERVIKALELKENNK